MHREVLAIFLILGLVWGTVQSCVSCGSECESACGTRRFRTCCFNYLKKRSQPEKLDVLPLMDPTLRLELWLAKERNSMIQENFEPNRDYLKEQFPLTSDDKTSSME